MSETRLILKEKGQELPVPKIWRQTLCNIVDAFGGGDFKLESRIDFVHSIAAIDAKRIAGNIGDYGDELVALSEETWESSICCWTSQSYWEVLIDLMTIDEGVSDLVLFVKVREDAGSYCFTIEDVHVP